MIFSNRSIRQIVILPRHTLEAQWTVSVWHLKTALWTKTYSCTLSNPVSSFTSQGTPGGQGISWHSKHTYWLHHIAISIHLPHLVLRYPKNLCLWKAWWGLMNSLEFCAYLSLESWCLTENRHSTFTEIKKKKDYLFENKPLMVSENPALVH